MVYENIGQNPAVVPQTAIMAQANQPKRQFVAPPKFKGTLDEDASEWIQRYESTGLYNRWEPADLAANFCMYLEDSARKWFMCSTLPAHWRDTPEVIGVPAAQNRVEVLAAAAEVGLKTKFLQEFQRENYALFQEAKLRNRDQGVEEETSRYYYDVIDLCRSVNPNMSEETKLEYLYRGLKSSLLEKIYPLRPRTCAEFLALVKIHTEASMIANRKGWMAKAEVDSKEVIIAALDQEAAAIERIELLKIVKDLQTQIEELENRMEEEEEN